MSFEATMLKQAIWLRHVDVINLKLTSDGKLIDKDIDDTTQTKNKDKVKDKVKYVDITRELMREVKGLNCYWTTINKGWSDDNKRLSFKIVNRIEDAEYEAVKRKLMFSYIHDDLIVVADKTRLMLCTQQKFRLPDTSSDYCLGGAFSNMHLKSINLKNIHSSDTKVMTGLFFNSTIEELNVENLDTSDARDITGMFMKCTAHITGIEKLDTHNVGNMQNMFAESKIKGDLNLSGLNTLSLDSTARMFKSANIEGILDLSNFNTSRVENMDEMFMDCKVGTLKMKELDMSKVYTSEDAFLNFKFKNGELNIKNYK
jgi:hypothetical protein